MNRESHPHDRSLEADPVWQLLDQAPAPAASARFVENTLRAARLEEAARPAVWWHRLLAPAPLSGLLAATAAVAIAAVSLMSPGSDPLAPAAVPQATASAEEAAPDFAALQEAAELEALLAAVDQLDDFSDHELVSLIGF